jgi:heme/copper-type cytochrome/quinol oxidase subunit 3
MNATSDNPNQQAEYDVSDDFQPPAGTGTFGMVLFLMSLTMLFAAGLIGYIIIRSRAEGVDIVGLPLSLWLSTGLIVTSSAFLHYANLSLKAGHDTAFRMGLLVTFLLGLGFAAAQAPGLSSLIETHQAAAEANVYLFSLIVFLVIVHGLHVVGGLIPMAVTLRKAFNDHYGPDNSEPVHRLTMYWHFLDVVWVVMFSTFLVLG